MPNTETFNNTDSWIARGCNGFAPPVHTLDDETKAGFRLNYEDTYVITLEGKVRTVTFERWHGGHAIFYSPYDDWLFCVWHENLRKTVKRVKGK